MKEEVFNFHKNNQFEHWWFVGRNYIIDSFLNKILTSKNNSFLDIGAGFGACIPVLKKFGNVSALEPYVPAHQTLKELGAEKVYSIADFPNSYPAEKFDIVTFFDVLEHIEDDSQALKIVKEQLLKKGGKCIITVPAYMWLWSKHDELNMHFRRYNRTNLKELLEKSGFKNVKVSYFMTILFPIALMARIFEKITGKGEVSDPKSGIVNSLFKKIFKLEAPLINITTLPFGLSLIAKGELHD